jgi:hypothetical protein
MLVELKHALLPLTGALIVMTTAIHAAPPKETPACTT